MKEKCCPCRPCIWFVSRVNPIIQIAVMVLTFVAALILIITGSIYLHNGDIAMGCAVTMLMAGIVFAVLFITGISHVICLMRALYFPS